MSLKFTNNNFNVGNLPEEQDQYQKQNESNFFSNQDYDVTVGGSSVRFSREQINDIAYRADKLGISVDGYIYLLNMGSRYLVNNITPLTPEEIIYVNQVSENAGISFDDYFMNYYTQTNNPPQNQQPSRRVQQPKQQLRVLPQKNKNVPVNGFSVKGPSKNLKVLKCSCEEENKNIGSCNCIPMYGNDFSAASGNINSTGEGNITATLNKLNPDPSITIPHPTVMTKEDADRSSEARKLGLTIYQYVALEQEGLKFNMTVPQYLECTARAMNAGLGVEDYINQTNQVPQQQNQELSHEASEQNIIIPPNENTDEPTPYGKEKIITQSDNEGGKIGRPSVGGFKQPVFGNGTVDTRKPTQPVYGKNKDVSTSVGKVGYNFN